MGKWRLGEESAEKIPILNIGLRELVGNFSPAYISLLLIMFLSEATLTFSEIAAKAFAASLVALALSAAQPFVVRRIVQPSRYVERYARDSARTLLKERYTDGEVFDEIVKRFGDTYSRYITSNIEEFWLKKITLPRKERVVFDIREARLLCFLYLGIVLAGLALVDITQLFLGTDWFPILNSANLLVSFPVLSLGVVVFFYGTFDEAKTYRALIVRRIPALMEAFPGNTIEELKDQQRFLKERRSSLTEDSYKELEAELKKHILYAEKSDFERKWIIKKVEEVTKIDIETVEKISEDMSRKFRTMEFIETLTRNLPRLVAVQAAIFAVYLFIRSGSFIQIIENYITFIPEPILLIFVLLALLVVMLGLRSMYFEKEPFV